MAHLRRLLAKKSDFGSIIVIISIGVIAAIVMLIFATMNDSLLGDTLAEEDFGNPLSNSTVSDMHTNNAPIFDNLGFWFLLASLIGLIVSAVYLGYHPVTMIIFGLMLFVGVFLAAEGANIRDDFANDDTIAPVSEDFIFSNISFGRYFPLIIAAIGVIVLIIMFAKKNAGGGF